MNQRDALNIITECAGLYDKQLLNKSVLFIYKDRRALQFKETIYQRGNFLHLTGVITKLSPKDFYKLCMQHRLSESDFMQAKNGTSDLKLRVLNELMHLPFRAKMIGDFDSLRLFLHTDLVAGSSYAAMGFISNRSVYIPNTALNEDTRKVVKEAFPILLTYRKDISDSSYSECCYTSKILPEDQIIVIKNYLLNAYSIKID